MTPTLAHELENALNTARVLSATLNDLLGVSRHCADPERACIERIGAKLVRVAHDAICGPTPAAELRAGRHAAPESPGDEMLDPEATIPFELTDQSPGVTPDGDGDMGEDPPPAPGGLVGNPRSVRAQSAVQEADQFDAYARIIARRRGYSVVRVRRAMGAQLEIQRTSLADLIGLGRLLAFIKAVIALLESELF